MLRFVCDFRMVRWSDPGLYSSAPIRGRTNRV